MIHQNLFMMIIASERQCLCVFPRGKRNAEVCVREYVNPMMHCSRRHTSQSILGTVWSEFRSSIEAHISPLGSKTDEWDPDDCDGAAQSCMI